MKRANLRLTQALAEVLPDHSAYVAFWWMKDAAVPLLFDRDIVILDPNADDGETAPVLIRQLLQQGRRVYLLATISSSNSERVMFGLTAIPVRTHGLELLELRVVSESARWR